MDALSPMLLVTGGAGYIGSHFIKTYLTQNPDAQVVVVDNLSEGHPQALDFSDRILFFQENIGNIHEMGEIFKRHPIDAIVHFAASCCVGESQTQPTRYFQNNVVNTLNLLKAMDEANIRKFLFSSTCATYGTPQRLPLDESHPQNPINVYGQTKLMIEQALQTYSATLGWSYTALRYFNAAGGDNSGLIGEGHSPETHLIPLVLKAALGKRDAIEIYGNDYDTPDGTCIRDYVHVNDLAMAHCKALERLNTQQGGDAFNLGTTHGASVQEVITLCQKVTGRDIPINHAPRRPGDPPVLVANADKAFSLLNWAPQYTLEKIIETAWAWEQTPRY